MMKNRNRAHQQRQSTINNPLCPRPCRGMWTMILALLACLSPWATPSAHADTLLVSSSWTNSVLEYDDTTGAFLGEFISPGSGGLNFPTGIAVGPDGSVYVGSGDSHEILKYDGVTGAFDSVFADASSGLTVPFGMTFGPDGHLYVASLQKSEVFKYDGGTGTLLTRFATTIAPISLTFGPDAKLYVVSTSNNSIWKHEPTTGASLGVLVPANTHVSSSTGLTFGSDGHIYVTDQTLNRVVRFDGSTGAHMGVFVAAGSGGVSGPYGIRFRSDGLLYVASGNTNNVLRYDATTGAFVDVFVTSGSGGLAGPSFMVFKPDPPAVDVSGGALLVGSKETDSVIAYDSTTGDLLGTFLSGGGLDWPTGIAVGPDGFIYVGSVLTNEILRYDAVTGAFDSVFADASSGLQYPFGMTFGPSGHLYVASIGSHEVLKFETATGNVVLTIPEGGSPIGVSVGADGNLYALDASTHQVKEYDGSTGLFLGLFVPGSPELHDPSDLRFGTNGDLYVNSRSEDRVVRFDGTSGAYIDDFIPPGLGGLDGPAGFQFRSDGMLYVLSGRNNSVLRYNATTGAFVDVFVTSGSGGLDCSPDANGYIEFLDPVGNNPPTADAGEDQAVDESQIVMLDGSGSGDPDADAIDYLWDQVAGPTVVLNTSDPVHPSFSAPGVGPEGAILTFELATFDGELFSEPDFVNVTVANINHPPLADAGGNQIVNELTLVTLDGTASFDPDGEPVGFQWLQTAGDPVTLLDETQPVAQFVAPEVTGPAVQLHFIVVVDDGMDASIAAVSITVENVNHAPDADAGDTQAVDENTPVVLDGSGSGDPDGDPLSYQWAQTEGTGVVLNLTDPVHPTFIAPEVASGTEMLVFELIVDDGLLDSESSLVTISVADVIAPPDCSLAEARIVQGNGKLSRDNVMWPPNHTMREVAIIGVADPQNLDVTIHIDRVTQDEPLNGAGDGNTDVDALVNVDGVLLLRAERSGSGNGRVYVIEFTAMNGAGASCQGVVQIVVPHSKRSTAINSGQSVTSWQ